MYADAYVNAKRDMPDEPHWAILKFGSIHVPGDERSRTNPGHGYPAHNEPVVKYEVYLTEEAMLAAVRQIEERPYHTESYTVIKVEPVQIKTEISVATG